jgi:hypothetical protein
MGATRTSWDVIVIGGGTAGLIAGIAAARLGAKTLIVERSGHLGGNAATGMNLGGFFDGDNVQVVRGIPQEFVARAVELRAGRGHIFFNDVDRWISSTASIDPEAFKSIALEKVEAAGCHLWLYATFARGVAAGDRVQAVEVVTKSGVSRLTATVFVDASGDGDLAASVGVPFERGGGTRQQAVTSIFRVSQVDLPAVERFMQEKINTEGKTPWTFENAPLRGSHRYWTPWKIFPEYAQKFPRQFGVYYHGVPGEVFLNCSHTTLPSLDPDDITRSTVRLRQQAVEILSFLQGHVPGFERASMTQVYDLGVRESRRIVGEYTLTLEDMVIRREFEDVVAMGAYPPDFHDAYGGEILISGKGWSRVHPETGIPNNPGYQIPLRCLLPRSVENLLVAGRCASATFEAQSGARGMGPCCAMGQAAGTAAALAVQQGVSPRALDIRQVQEALLKEGAYLGRRFETRR